MEDQEEQEDQEEPAKGGEQADDGFLLPFAFHGVIIVPFVFLGGSNDEIEDEIADLDSIPFFGAFFVEGFVDPDFVQ